MKIKHRPGAVLSIVTLLLSTSVFALPRQGRWLHEQIQSATGALDVAEYVPPLPQSGRYGGLILALHGCHQQAVDFAAITRLPQLADQHGLLLIFPQQSERLNPDRCWNWFLPVNQARLSGEPLLMISAVDRMLAQYSVDTSKIYVVGMSAGAVMANIMSSTYPDVFTGAAIHSGIEFGDPLTVQDALDGHMRCPILSGVNSGQLAFASSGLAPERLANVIIFYGDQDRRVYPCNSHSIADQWLQMKSLATRGLLDMFDLSKLAVVTRHTPPERDAYVQTDWRTPDGWAMREVMVEGMAHAWSGGPAGLFASDPNGPDATAMLWRFFVGRK